MNYWSWWNIYICCSQLEFCDVSKEYLSKFITCLCTWSDTIIIRIIEVWGWYREHKNTFNFWCSNGNNIYWLSIIGNEVICVTHQSFVVLWGPRNMSKQYSIQRLWRMVVTTNLNSVILHFLALRHHNYGLRVTDFQQVLERVMFDKRVQKIGLYNNVHHSSLHSPNVQGLLQLKMRQIINVQTHKKRKDNHLQHFPIYSSWRRQWSVFDWKDFPVDC